LGGKKKLTIGGMKSLSKAEGWRVARHVRKGNRRGRRLKDLTGPQKKWKNGLNGQRKKRTVLSKRGLVPPLGEEEVLRWGKRKTWEEEIRTSYFGILRRKDIKGKKLMGIRKSPKKPAPKCSAEGKSFELAQRVGPFFHAGRRTTWERRGERRKPTEVFTRPGGGGARQTKHWGKEAVLDRGIDWSLGLRGGDEIIPRRGVKGRGGSSWAHGSLGNKIGPGGGEGVIRRAQAGKGALIKENSIKKISWDGENATEGSEELSVGIFPRKKRRGFQQGGFSQKRSGMTLSPPQRSKNFEVVEKKQTWAGSLRRSRKFILGKLADEGIACGVKGANIWTHWHIRKAGAQELKEKFPPIKCFWGGQILNMEGGLWKMLKDGEPTRQLGGGREDNY